MFNRELVNNFSRQYAAYIGQQISCFYDPWDIRSGAVLTAAVPNWSVFHAVFWPFLCVAVGLIVCIVFCHRCHQDTSPPNCDTSSSTQGVPDDVTGYVVATRALLNAQKRHKHRSIRNLWMMQQNAWSVCLLFMSCWSDWCSVKMYCCQKLYIVYIILVTVVYATLIQV